MCIMCAQFQFSPVGSFCAIVLGNYYYYYYYYYSVLVVETFF